MTDFISELGAPKIVNRSTFQAELDALQVREKAHTHEGDAIAAARRGLPMVEVDPAITLTGPHGAGNASRHVRGPSTAHRLLFYVAHRPPGARAVRGLHVGYDAGP
jgi:predicted dithiol-disulfide oxidoreductase (DUF899 family)